MIEIKNRYTGEVIYKSEYDSLIKALEDAAKSGADLCGADLYGADLCGANLCGADLCGADLCGANLCGANLCGADLCGANLCGANGEKLTLLYERPYLSVGPLGSRADILQAFFTNGGIYLRTGYFWGAIDEFRQKLASTHGDNEHRKEYEKALELVVLHAEIWTPKAT